MKLEIAGEASIHEANHTLRDNEAALVWSETDGFTLYLPDHKGSDPAPEPVVMLSVLLIMLDGDDPMLRGLCAAFLHDKDRG